MTNCRSARKFSLQLRVCFFSFLFTLLSCVFMWCHDLPLPIDLACVMRVAKEPCSPGCLQMDVLTAALIDTLFFSPLLPWTLSLGLRSRK